MKKVLNVGGNSKAKIRQKAHGMGLECASCHSVHNTGNDGESLLWRSDINSELCLTCHMKGTYTTP